MTKEEIADMIHSWENLNFYIQHFLQYPENLPVLLQAACDDSRKEYWRAAWMVDKIAEQSPGLVRPFFPQLIRSLKTTKNQGKLRHFLKIISQNPIPETQLDFLFSFCLKLFTDPAYPVAVRVHAMQILYEISETEHGLKPELIQLIEHEIELHPTAGIKARGKHLLQKLYRCR